MNRLRGELHSAESGDQAFGASFDRPISDLNVDVMETVDDFANGDLCLQFQSDDQRTDIQVHLDDERARALAASINELSDTPTATAQMRKRTLPAGGEEMEIEITVELPDPIVEECRDAEGEIDPHAVSDRISVRPEFDGGGV